MSVSTPLFIEDENIFQKSAYVVELLLQFLVQPRRPIFGLHQKFYFLIGILIQIGRCRKIICIGISYTAWLHTVTIHNWRFSSSHIFTKIDALEQTLRLRLFSGPIDKYF